MSGNRHPTETGIVNRVYKATSGAFRARVLELVGRPGDKSTVRLVRLDKGGDWWTTLKELQDPRCYEPVLTDVEAVLADALNRLLAETELNPDFCICDPDRERDDWEQCAYCEAREALKLTDGVAR